MLFRLSVQRTSYPSLRINVMNSSRLRAYRIHSSMVFISRNFQLSPLAAVWYSAPDIDLTFCLF